MRRFPRFFGPLAFSLLLGGSVLTASAQEPSIAKEQLYLRTGDVFEMLAADAAPDAQYAWVLSMDRTFIQASRQALFRVRIVDAGTYRLDASVQTQDGALSAQRTFFLSVLPRQESTSSEDGAAASSGSIVTTDPTVTGGLLFLPTDRQVVRFAPARDDITRISLNVDTDRDESSGPIDDAAGSFLASGQTPLYIWFSSPDRLQRTMRASADLADGSSLAQTILLLREGSPVPTESEGPIEAVASSDGSVRFSYAAPETDVGTPLLYHWSFGDGAESLQTEPSHRYIRGGTYDVRVTVLDLTTGQTVANAQSDVTVETYIPVSESGAVAGASSSASSAASAASSEATTVTEPSSSQFSRILILVLVLIGAIGLGAGGVWLVIRLLGKGGGLQKRLEEAESRLLSEKNGKPSSPLDVAPLEIRRAEREPSPVEPPQPAEPPSPPPVEPEVNLNEAPPWLREGLEKQQEPALTPTAPPPQETPAPTPASPAAEERPAWLSAPSPAEQATPLPAEPTPKPAPAAESTTPSWLFPPESPKPTETAVPPSATDTTPIITTEPPAPAPAPAVDMTNAPDWLRQGMQAARQETVPPTPATPPTPVTPPPTPVPEPAPPPLPLQTPEPEPLPATPPPSETIPEAEPVIPPIQETAQAADTAEEPVVEARPENETAPPAAPQPRQKTQADLEREERERERKRLKRQRYRQNLKKRQQTQSADSAKQPSVPQTAATKPAVPAPPPQNETPMKREERAVPKQEKKPMQKDIPAAPVSPAQPSKEATKPGDGDVVFVVEAENLKKADDNGQNKH